MSTRRVWCEHAWLPAGLTSGVTIDIDGDRIVGVRAATAATADTERLSGLTVPGFANGHSHAFHRALRGRTQRGAGDFWTWRSTMYELSARLTPDNYLALARATFAEMALAGFTCVGEFHYVHHAAGGGQYDDPNAMGKALVEAARQAGVRLTLLDACYLQAGLDALPAPPQLRFSDGDAGRWAERTALLQPTALARHGAAVHSVRAVPADAITVVADVSTRRGQPLHAHVSEQPAENAATLAAHGCSPTALLERSGALGPRFTAVHATHLLDSDVVAFAINHCTCCLCPTTERDLADGIGPGGVLRAAGVALSIGTDQHACVDPFEELRGVEMHERMATGRRGSFTAAELVAAGAAGGYRSLGWDGGRIAAGALADLTTVRLDSVRLAGAAPADLLEAVVFAAAAPDVSEVIVGGASVVRDGRHLAVDVAAALHASISAVWA